ncbi:hypothetical protein C9I56_37150 [Paraburkholderia caribensis]|nr:hypothetical protein C9I56_37150 [Paraburkholderia caribensis]
MCDPETMRVIPHDECWTIEHATYFDGDRHIWQEADIEISSGKIVGLRNPGTSRATIRRDARGLLCLPGLVGASLRAGGAGANLYDGFRQALASGFTTVGIFSEDVAHDAQTASAFGIRTVFYHVLRDRWLGRGRRPETMPTDACICRFQQASRCTRSSRVSVLPAIGSQFGASPALLVALHEMAKREAYRLVIRLDAGLDGISDFHDAYGCTGVSLLSNLDVLDQYLLVFPVSSLSRLDWRLMSASSCRIVACDLRHWDSMRPHRFAAFDREFTSRFLDLEESDDRKSPSEKIVDVLTWKGAESLALDNLGKIAIGQRADLLLYADSTENALHCHQSASDLFIQCVARHRPLAAYVDGRPVESPGAHLIH